MLPDFQENLGKLNEKYHFREGGKWKVRRRSPEAESKEKHGVWDPMPEYTIT
jgi:hypothetical protein